MSLSQSIYTATPALQVTRPALNAVNTRPVRSRHVAAQVLTVSSRIGHTMSPRTSLLAPADLEALEALVAADTDVQGFLWHRSPTPSSIRELLPLPSDEAGPLSASLAAAAVVDAVAGPDERKEQKVRRSSSTSGDLLKRRTKEQSQSHRGHAYDNQHVQASTSNQTAQPADCRALHPEADTNPDRTTSALALQPAVHSEYNAARRKARLRLQRYDSRLTSHATPLPGAGPEQDAAATLHKAQYRSHKLPMVLTPKEETALAIKCRDGVALHEAEKQIASVLGRQPTTEELARAVRSTPREVRQRMSAGIQAKQRLIACNMALVRKVATWAHREYVAGTFRNMKQRELVQEGVHGLIRAVEKFDPHAGYKLSTYAVPWIRQRMQRALQMQEALIRLPAPVHEQVSKYRRAVMALKAELGRAPTRQQLAARLGWNLSKVDKMMAAHLMEVCSGNTLVLDGTANEHDEPTLQLTADSDTMDSHMLPPDSLLVTDMEYMLERAVDVTVRHRGSDKSTVKAGLMALFRSRMGLSDHLLADERASSSRGYGLTAVSRMCGLSCEQVRSLCQAVQKHLRTMHGEELEELARTVVEGDGPSMAERVPSGANKKSR